MDESVSPLYAMAAAVACLDALFLWWVWRQERAAIEERARRAGYRPVLTRAPVPV